jgi:hypothetical protein
LPFTAKIALLITFVVITLFVLCPVGGGYYYCLLLSECKITIKSNTLQIFRAKKLLFSAKYFVLLLFTPLFGLFLFAFIVTLFPSIPTGRGGLPLLIYIYMGLDGCNRVGRCPSVFLLPVGRLCSCCPLSV